MERLSIKSLALVFLLFGCQTIEINNDNPIDFIPDLSEPKNDMPVKVEEVPVIETTASINIL